jgi:muramidase (phage lysozyme)
LACVKQRESGGNYQAVGAGYYGAYQFAPSTWDATARHAGRLDLVGVRPDRASPADQDAMALHLLQWQGRAPWGGYC